MCILHIYKRVDLNALKVCVSLKKIGTFWSFPLQIQTFLAFIIRKIPATFDFIFILLKNTNKQTVRGIEIRKRKKKLLELVIFTFVCYRVKKHGLFRHFGSTFLVLSLCLRCLTVSQFTDRHKVKQHSKGEKQ